MHFCSNRDIAVLQMLEEIGAHCPFLVELELSGTPVSDRGLVRLCVGSEGTRQCQRLTRLVISETSVSSAGVVVVLQSLPLLSEFDFDNIFEVRGKVNNNLNHFERSI